jgi:hypothetical protein
MQVVQVSIVGGINGRTGKECGWKGGEVFDMVAKKGRLRLVMALKDIGAMTGDSGDDIGATKAVGKFGDGAGGSVTLHLNASHDKVTNGI